MTPAEREELLAANRRAREAAREQAGDDEVPPASGSEPGVRGKPAPEAPSATRSPWITPLLGAATAALAVATGVLAYLYATAGDGLGPDSGLGKSAVDDAKRYAEQIVTYSAGDYAALDKQIRSISTPEFADRYIQSSQEARKGNDEAKASSTATAQVAGLESITDAKAQVLVALDQQITSPELPSAGEAGLEYQRRVLISLVRDGDRWVVADLTQV